jgi:hypothetical protein
MIWVGKDIRAAFKASGAVESAAACLTAAIAKCQLCSTQWSSRAEWCIRQRRRLNPDGAYMHGVRGCGRRRCGDGAPLGEHAQYVCRCQGGMHPGACLCCCVFRLLGEPAMGQLDALGGRPAAVCATSACVMSAIQRFSAALCRGKPCI